MRLPQYLVTGLMTFTMPYIPDADSEVYKYDYCFCETSIRSTDYQVVTAKYVSHVPRRVLLALHCTNMACCTWLHGTHAQDMAASVQNH